jgi:hypothetical protein
LAGIIGAFFAFLHGISFVLSGSRLACVFPAGLALGFGKGINPGQPSGAKMNQNERLLRIIVKVLDFFVLSRIKCAFFGSFLKHRALVLDGGFAFC